MLGSQALETAIGLALVFGLLALVASGLRETVEALLQTRAIGLERGVREMLDDATGTGAARALFAHPLVAGLYRGAYDPARLRETARGDRRLPFGSRLPAYLPARVFGTVVVDLARTAGAVPGVVGAMAADAGGDEALLRERIEHWYDDAMARVSGWYRKQTQVILFAIGLALAIGCNVDALAMARDLYAGEAVRAAIVAEAARAPACATPACATARIEALPLPLGWREVPRAMPWAAVPGWLLSALAITVGAPFWFDVLGRLTTVRSTLKPRAEGAAAPFEPYRWAGRADPHEGLL